MCRTRRADGRLRPLSRESRQSRRLIVYRFGADLFYANADRFADEALALIDGAPAPVRWFVVDASAMTDIDYSAARTLHWANWWPGVRIAFGRVSPSLHADMQRRAHFLDAS
jgi:sulfate permease, SulP family